MNNQKIIRITVKNFKKIKYIEIDNISDFNIVSGNNRNGKSSFLDAIQCALEGPRGFKSTKTIEPIRIGSQQAEVTIEVTDYTISRFWSKEGKHKLIIMPKDSATEPLKNQTMLNNFLGSFVDPSLFYHLDNDKQAKILMRITGIEAELENLKGRKELVYNRRTDTNRDKLKLKKVLESMSKPKDNLPSGIVSSKDITDRLELAQNKATERTLLETNSKSLLEEESRLENEIERLKQRLEANRTEQKEVKEKLNNIEIPNIESIKNELLNVEELNNDIRHALKYSEVQNELDDLEAKSLEETEEIKEWDNKIKKLLSDTKFPIEGLSFDETGIVYKGVPYSQCSSEEKITIAASVAMSENDKKFKILLVRDGATYDKYQLKALEDLAKERKYLVFFEKPGDFKEFLYIDPKQVIGNIKDGELNN